MNKVLCSTGAIIGRPNGRDFTLLEKFRRLIDCDGYEFMMYDTWYDRVDELKRFVLSLDISIPVFHVEKSIGELMGRNFEGDLEKALELFEVNCALANEFGAEKLVLHLWNGVISDKNIAYNIEGYRYLKGIAEAHALELCVENVVCSEGDPMSHFKALAKKYSDVKFTFDTKMAAFHNQIQQFCSEENRYVLEKTCHMHINDYKGGYKDFNNLKTLHIGKGNIDFQGIFDNLRRVNYRGDFTVEATSFGIDGEVDHCALNESIDAVRRYIST